MKKIIITGASGLIGNSLLDFFSRENFDLIALYNSSQPVIASNEKIKLCHIDIVNEDLTQFNDFKADCLIHCAAIIPTSFDKENLDFAANSNKIIDENIISFCKINNIKLIYFSSVSIYENNAIPFKETDYVFPANAYSIEKLNTELNIARKLNDYLIFRISSPYGKFQKNKNVLKIFVDNVISDKNIDLYNNGTRHQDFIHVTDINHATLKAIYACKLNSVINLAYGQTISMLELAETILSLKINSSSKIVISGKKDAFPDYNPMIDISKALALLDWKPLIDIRTGLKDFFIK